MATVRVHSSSRQQAKWEKVINGLRLDGVKIYNQPQDADVSIVLSGKHENPAMLKGRKVLAFDAGEWIKFMNPPNGWIAYAIVLEEYYDDFINLSGMTDSDKIKTVKEMIGKYESD